MYALIEMVDICKYICLEVFFFKTKEGFQLNKPRRWNRRANLFQIHFINIELSIKLRIVKIFRRQIQITHRNAQAEHHQQFVVCFYRLLQLYYRYQ